NTKGSLDKIVPVIKDDLNIISSVSSSASKSISTLIDALNKGAEDAPLIVDSLQTKLSNLSSTTKTLVDFLSKLDKITPGHPLKDAIAQLQSINTKINTSLSSLNIIKDQIASGQKPSFDNLNKILKVTNDINNISSSILNNFDSQIINPINSIFKQGLNVANEAIDILENAEAKLPKVEDILNTSLEFSGSAKDNVEFIKEKIPMAKSIVDELVSAMNKINNSDDMSELISLLKNDAIKQANFLKEPINLVTEKLYPMANYGSGMTPFYTVLCLWVGILLLVSLLSTEVQGNFNPIEVYFGRGLTFLSITVIQALIVSLGDIYLLKVSVENPALLVGISIFTSIIFTTIVYSLVSLLGNVGKAIGIVLLVIQVAASGGTFPIQVTPKFFQIVNPFLPFTYAISAMREAVGGVYAPNLNKDLIILALFIVILLPISAILKKPLNKILAPLKAKFSESDLTGH
ncbi:MAG: YhgE/Pip domain-containing protein, partial [Romboutsia sp.]